jgi:hypothetical protein
MEWPGIKRYIMIQDGTDMSFIRWIQSWFSRRGHALAEYRSGIKKAGKYDYPGAIVDYTAVIDSEHSPEDLKTMAIYNRALAYSAMDEVEKASHDLDTVLKMQGVSQRVKTAVLRRQERIRQRSQKQE